MLIDMWKRALAAGLFVGVGVAGTLAVQDRGPEPRPVQQARSYDTAGELLHAIQGSGVTCVPLDTGKYAGCQVPDGGPILTVQAAQGSSADRTPIAPALVSPNWVVTADESNRSDVLAQVQQAVGGRLLTVPGVPAGPATVDYLPMTHEPASPAEATCKAVGQAVVLGAEATAALPVEGRFTAYAGFAQRQMSPPTLDGTGLRRTCTHQAGPEQQSYSVFEVRQQGVMVLRSGSNDCPQCMGIIQSARVNAQ